MGQRNVSRGEKMSKVERDSGTKGVSMNGKENKRKRKMGREYGI